MMPRGILLAAMILFAPPAWAQCVGAGGVPFNCPAQNAVPQPNDVLLLGVTATGLDAKVPYGFLLPQATTSVLGGVKCDGTTITCASGVITAVGGGGGGGSVMTGSANGIGRPDSVSTVVAGSGVFSVSDSIQVARTSAITFVAGDMGTLIPASTGVSSITISATNYASTVFGAGQTSCVQNNTAGAVPVTNSSGASMFPAFTSLQVGETICLTGDGMNMFSAVSKAPVSNVPSGGTGLSSIASGAIPRGAGTNPLVPSNLSDTGTLVSSAVATTGGQTALTDGGTITVDGQHDTYTLTLTGNHTMLNPGVLNLGQNITFVITQDGTGSRVITWSADYNWMSGAPALLNPAPGSVTFISCKVNTAATLWCAGGAPVPNYQTFSCALPHTTSTGAATLTCFMRAPRAFTVDNVTATVAGTFTTVTATLFECGTSTTCASTPVTMTTGAVTTANTATPLTVASATINSGDYIAVELTAGTITAVDVNVQVEMH